MESLQVAQPSRNRIQVKYQDSEYEWYFRYEYEEGNYWEEYYYKSEKEALVGGVQYVKTQLLAKRRQAQAIINDVDLRLDSLNMD